MPRWVMGLAVVTMIAGIGHSQIGGLGGAMASGSTPRLQVGSAGEMIGFAGGDGSGQTITLIHTGKSWMSVYHIAPDGEIRLTGSRPIDADFSLQLNATDPLPEDIRRAAGIR